MDDAHSHGLTVLREKLDDPDVATTLTRLLDRIDRLETTLARLTEVVEQAPNVIATAGDLADEAVRSAARRGVDVEERIRAGLQLLERLSDPALQTSLAGLLSAAEQAQGAAAMIGDMVDETANQVDLAPRVEAGASLLERATRPDTIEQVSAMMNVLLEAESGMLNEEAVRILNTSAQALISAKGKPTSRVSLWQALKAAREPEVQKALGFLIEVGRQFGTRLDDTH